MTRREKALGPVLVLVTASLALISSVGFPLLYTISEEMHVTLSAAQWTLTVTILVGAVTAPILGRLGDGRQRRPAMIIGLLVVTLGGVVAALAPSLAIIIVGRAMQGVGLGIMPLAMAAARDHMPRERAHSTIALLSVSMVAGTAVGYPISGLMEHAFGLAGAYWLSAITSVLALICVVLVVPPSTTKANVTLDVNGALLLGAGLVSLLLGIGQAKAWGWNSPAILALLTGAALLLTAWVLMELRASEPVVNLRLLRHPAVMTANVCAMILGVTMYMFFTAVLDFVQTPVAAGYGFAATVTLAGLCVVPLSVTSVTVSRMLPWLTAHLGARNLLPLSSLTIAAAGVFFAVAHDTVWQTLTMMAITGVGLGLTAAVMPGLIVRSVPDHETGSALGFYQVVRFIGMALGSAIAGLIIAGHTATGALWPEESGYILVLLAGAGLCVIAAVFAWALPGTPVDQDVVDDDFAIENAELGPVGLVGLQDKAP